MAKSEPRIITRHRPHPANYGAIQCRTFTYTIQRGRPVIEKCFRRQRSKLQRANGSTSDP